MSLVRLRVRQWAVVSAAGLLPMLAYDTETAASSVHKRARTTWDSVFTADQATRGESTYTRTCARCHKSGMGGGDESPALTGSAFMSGWNGLTLFELHDRIRTTMPSDTPGTYSRADIADVMAYMLKFNQFPAGKAELPASDEELKNITFTVAKP